jgi:hypothetical protein
MVYSIIYWAFLHPWVVEYHLMGSTLGKVSLYFLYVSSDFCFLCPNLIAILFTESCVYSLHSAGSYFLSTDSFLSSYSYFLSLSYQVPACFLSALSCLSPSRFLLCCSMVLLPCYSFICCLILYITFFLAFFMLIFYFVTCLSP